MSLSSVVSTLMRASMGSSVPSTVADDDLDAHVRDLLIKDAKKRAERYSQLGIRAYLSSNTSDSSAPKANKRFLSSIIRSTDDHNKTILRAQAQAAEEIKRERRETERREKRARAEEAVAAEQARLRRKVNDNERWDRWDGRTGERKRKTRDWETWDGSDGEHRSRRHRHHRRHRSRSRSPSRKDDRRSRRSRRHRSRSKDHSEARSKDRSKDRSEACSKDRSKETSRQDDVLETPAPPPEPQLDKPIYTIPKASSSSSTLSSGMDMSSRSPTPGPEPAPNPPSKMDKYFEESYDPRLDVAPLTVPQVPATGLINNAEFEGWDAMLELLRRRREDKEEKRRLERLGYSKDEIHKYVTTGSVSDRWNAAGTSVMDIEYKKRGTVREWDLGKEGL